MDPDSGDGERGGGRERGGGWKRLTLTTMGTCSISF
jgi:hypothetical protein